MTKKYKVKNCPFCGKHPQVIKNEKEEIIDGKTKRFWSVGLYCNNCLYGLTVNVNEKSETIKALIHKIEQWNTRVS